MDKEFTVRYTEDGFQVVVDLPSATALYNWISRNVAPVPTDAPPVIPDVFANSMHFVNTVIKIRQLVNDYNAGKTDTTGFIHAVAEAVKE